MGTCVALAFDVGDSVFGVDIWHLFLNRKLKGNCEKYHFFYTFTGPFGGLCCVELVQFCGLKKTPHEPPGLHLGILGSIGPPELHLGLLGSIWASWAPFGPPGLHLGPLGSIWACWTPFGPPVLH